MKSRVGPIEQGQGAQTQREITHVALFVVMNVDLNASRYSLSVKIHLILRSPSSGPKVGRVVLICDELDYKLVWFWSKHASHSFVEVFSNISLSCLIQCLPNVN